MEREHREQLEARADICNREDGVGLLTSVAWRGDQNAHWWRKAHRPQQQGTFHVGRAGTRY